MIDRRQIICMMEDKWMIERDLLDEYFTCAIQFLSYCFFSRVTRLKVFVSILCV